MSLTDRELIDAAIRARERAYAPYSGFRVGAAVLCSSGAVILGANVENASYGLTNCAERVALQACVMAGERDLLRVAIVADTAGPVSPCGACRQVMSELAPNAVVVAANLRGAVKLATVQDLLPGSFTNADLSEPRPSEDAKPRPIMEPTLPLEGLSVVDLSRILAGPFATQKLADMGASVIKVERPGGGDDTRSWGPPFVAGHSTYFLSVNRGKKSLELDLKSARGKEALTRLVRGADVLVENFRPGVLERLGFAWDQLRALNPRLIYCSVSGYGHRSRYRDEPSFDVLVQAESGVMELTGPSDGPPFKFGISIADEAAGQLAVEGILLALLQRQKTGRGDWVDISLFDSMLSLLGYQGQLALSAGIEPRRMGNHHPSIAPYGCFPTKTVPVVVAAANEKLWKKLCSAVTCPELHDRRFTTNRDRVVHRDALIETLNNLFSSRSADDWVLLFRAAGVPATRLRTVSEAFEKARGDTRNLLLALRHGEIGKLEMVGHPVRFASAFRPVLRPPPRAGEHNEEILEELGMTAAAGDST